MIVACVLLVVFALVASTDSLYFHTYKYALHARPQSRYEHYLHTANICLFVPQAYLMFCVRPAGAWLWLALGLSAVTLAIELADVLCENDSRRDLGGLTPTEYAMHFLMSSLRASFVGIFAGGLSRAELFGPAALSPSPWATIGWCMVVPGVLVIGLHLALCLWPSLLSGGVRRTAPVASRPEQAIA